MIDNDILQVMIETKSRFLIIDDTQLNPLEILVLTDKRDAKKKCNVYLEKLKDGGVKSNSRMVRVLTFRDIGIGNIWCSDLYAKAQVHLESVYYLRTIDTIWVELAYVLCYCQKDFWLYKNVMMVIKEQVGVSKDKEVGDCFRTYLGSGKYEFRYVKIRNFSFEMVYSQNTYKILKIKQGVIKFVNILLAKYARFYIACHDIKTRKKYINELKQVFTGCYMDILNKAGESSSGCVFVHVKQKHKQLFIKGNESALYHSLKNEINVQKRLNEARYAKERFLLMDTCNENYEWISYPYMAYPSLKNILSSRTLRLDELEILGEFLIWCIQELNNIKVIHRDIRIENIMARIDSSGAITDYILFDFGYSVVEFNDILKSGKRWDKHIANVVGGSNRYNDRIIDDAAAAQAVYLSCGGNVHDCYAEILRKSIGKRYLV